MTRRLDAVYHSHYELQALLKNRNPAIPLKRRPVITPVLLFTPNQKMLALFHPSVWFQTACQGLGGKTGIMCNAAHMYCSSVCPIPLASTHMSIRPRCYLCCQLKGGTTMTYIQYSYV